MSKYGFIYCKYVISYICFVVGKYCMQHDECVNRTLHTPEDLRNRGNRVNFVGGAKGQIK